MVFGWMGAAAAVEEEADMAMMVCFEVILFVDERI